MSTQHDRHARGRSPCIREPGGEWQTLWDYLCDGAPPEDSDLALARRIAPPPPEEQCEFLLQYLEARGIGYEAKDVLWQSYRTWMVAHGEHVLPRAVFEQRLLLAHPELYELRLRGREYWVGLRLKASARRAGGDAV